MIRQKKTCYVMLGGVFILLVLARAPVSLSLGLLPKEIRLAGCEGTLWQGRASALGINGQVLQENLRWNLLPAKLLEGRLAWDVHGAFNQEKSRLTLLLGPTQIAMQDIQLTLPAGPLLGLHARLRTLQPGGLLHLKSTQFALNQPSTLEGRLENLFSPLAPTSGPLGSYRLMLSTVPNQPVQWKISPQDGMLAIFGNGLIDTRQGTASGTLTFKPQEKAAASLKTLLAALPENGGSHTLNFASR